MRNLRIILMAVILLTLLVLIAGCPPEKQPLRWDASDSIEGGMFNAASADFDELVASQ